MLTLPRHVRFALARDARLATKVIGIWLRAREAISYPAPLHSRASIVGAGGAALKVSQGAALNVSHPVSCGRQLESGSF